MNDDILSKDQIDGLSGGTDLGAIEENSAGAGAAGTDYTALTQVFGIVADQGTTVLTTVLSKEVKLETETCAAANVEEIKSKYGRDHLMLTVPWNKGFTGQQYFVISKKDTAVLADLMMMGDGAAEYEEDHKDAINELVNQIMGAVATSLGIRFGMECGVTPATVENFDPATTSVPLAQCAAVRMSLTVKDVINSGILILVPEALATMLAEKAAASQKNGAEETAEAGGAGETAEQADEVQTSSALESTQFAGFKGGGTGRGGAGAGPATPGNINMLLDIQLDVAIELGRTIMSIKRILELGPGSIIELDRMAGEPVDLLVNGKVVAKGEVVVVDENFGIRIVSLVSPEERLKSLK